MERCTVKWEIALLAPVYETEAQGLFVTPASHSLILTCHFPLMGSTTQFSLQPTWCLLLHDSLHFLSKHSLRISRKQKTKNCGLKRHAPSNAQSYRCCAGLVVPALAVPERAVSLLLAPPSLVICLSLKMEIYKLPLLSMDLSLCSSFISAFVKRYSDNVQYRREKGLFVS